MRMKNLLAAGAALAASLGLAQAAAAASQYYYYTFTNNTSESLALSSYSNSGSGGYWSPTPTATAAAGGTSSGTYITNDYATTNFSETWKSNVDGTYCTFSMYSQTNSYGNIQFYESTSSGGPRATSVTCAWTSPAQPYSTIHGNVTGAFKMGGF